MPVIEVSDIDDPVLEDYRDIRDRGLRGRDGYPGLFVGEQPLVVEQMLRVPGAVKSVLLGPKWVQRIAPQVAPETPVYVAPLEIMKRIAGFNIHRGVLAVGHRPAVERPDLDPELRHRATLTLLLSFGVDAVLLSPRCHDPLYRKSLRVSIGHALTVPFARSADWPADLDRLRDAWGVTLIAAALDPRAVDLDGVGRPDRMGLVVGQEYEGISSETLDRCDHVVRIPMAPGVDSLNVAVAAAVCLHRFSRGSRT
jgi:tRNA G18 (ribose-2'-O)-methylase SpoU